MSNRPATVLQADIHRTIKAMRQAKLTIVRLVLLPDGGVAIETDAAPEPQHPPEHPVEEKRIIL